MDKIDSGSSSSAIAQPKGEESKQSQQPKVDFAKVLQSKTGETAGNAARQQGAQALAQQATQAGAQQAAMAQSKAAMGQPQISNRPLPINPHLSKVKEAAKQFDLQLGKAKAASVEQKQVMHQQRAEGKALDHARASERASDVAKTEAHSEVVRGESSTAAAETRAKSAAQAMNHAHHAGKQASRNAIEGLGAQPAETAKGNAATEVKRTRRPREIPQELLDKLVEEVRVGVNAAGQSEFQIDLKQGVLQGMSLRVTSNNGKVSCTFVGGDNHARNLIESSEQRLSRALDKVGLQLESLKVVGV
ncbi:MAG: hypothetical protein JXR83_06440 [Deltaproteobacteria bacterium]|nr:hypothetical protein [Deltaproteobacteria bacterium]